MPYESPESLVFYANIFLQNSDGKENLRKIPTVGVPNRGDAPNDISGTAEARIVKFCMQVDYQILAYGDKSPQKRRGQESRDPFLGRLFDRVDLIKPVC